MILKNKLIKESRSENDSHVLAFLDYSYLAAKIKIIESASVELYRRLGLGDSIHAKVKPKDYNED
jgi:hypothetical protein